MQLFGNERLKGNIHLVSWVQEMAMYSTGQMYVDSLDSIVETRFLCLETRDVWVWDTRIENVETRSSWICKLEYTFKKIYFSKEK